MTDYDPLEAELATFRPCEPSPQLKQRLAAALNPDLPPRSGLRRRLGWAGAVAAGLAAAAAAMFLIGREDGPAIEPELPAAVLAPRLAAAFDQDLPSFWTYRAALAQSPESLESLLDQHALRTPEPKPERARVYVFARFDPELDDPWGEL
jgi:hypothetical protein